MFYAKNLPRWERALRILAAIAATGYAIQSWGNVMAVIVSLTAMTLALTGMVGFCPMCALAGRKPLRKE